jgi:ribokinase
VSGYVLVVGSLNMDLVVRSPYHPRPGETVLGDGFGTFPGGKGANQAVAAARLGAEVKMIGRVGQDAFGDSMLETLANDGVDTTYVLRDADSPTGVALITVDAAGQNTIVVASGANADLSVADIDAAEDAFEGAAVLLVQLESPLPAVARAIELAKAHGVKVVLNPAPAQPLDADLLANVDYLIPNQTELAMLAGLQPTAAVELAIRRLREKAPTRLIVTLGEAGAITVDGNGMASVPPIPVDTVDTTAAGDAFVGAFGVALTEGYDIETATRWGNAAGALATTRAGAQPSLPTRNEIETLLNGAPS